MFLGEVLGTGTLIFIGCMGCIGTLGVAPPPPMQTAFTFGLTVNLLIMVSRLIQILLKFIIKKKTVRSQCSFNH